MNVEVANRLQQLRKAKGLSQEELANILGLSRQAISKWERAETSPDTDNLICLAKLYNISIDTLLSTDESLEEIKERIAQERIDEIDKEKDQAIKEEIKNGEENSDEQAQEDIIDAELTDEQKEVEKKANNKEGDIIISLFGLGLIAYLIIGSFTNDWTWGWVLPVMGLFGAGMVTGLYSERHFSILSLAFIAVLFIMALKYALESNANVYYIVIASISISSFFILSIVRFIFFIIFEYKNRENLELIYHKKRLIEERNKYLKMEEAYEKYKKELGKIKL